MSVFILIFKNALARNSTSLSAGWELQYVAVQLQTNIITNIKGNLGYKAKWKKKYDWGKLN